MTPLDKDISRETTIDVGGRLLQVTLTANQTIEFKLKGLKSGIVSASIKEVYDHLMDDDSTITLPGDKVEKAEESFLKKQSGNPMISLNQLRSKLHTTPMSNDSRVELEHLVVECIKTS